MIWYGADCNKGVFYFYAKDEAEAIRIAERDFGSSKLANSLPLVLGEFWRNQGISPNLLLWI